MKVILVIDTQGLKDKIKFDEHLIKEGFLPIENEKFAYELWKFMRIITKKRIFHKIIFDGTFIA